MSFISSLTLMPSNLDIEIKTGWIERHSEQHIENKAWVLAWFENSGVYAGKKVGFRFQQTRIGIPILSLDGAPKGNHFSCLWSHLLMFEMKIKMSSSMSCLRFRNWRQICSLDPDSELNVRLLGEVGKNSFIAFPVKQGHSGLIPSKLCDPYGGNSEESYSVQGAEHGHLMGFLLSGWWWGDGELASSTCFQPVWGLCAYGQHTVSFSQLGEVSASAKQLKDISVCIPWMGGLPQ